MSPTAAASPTRSPPPSARWIGAPLLLLEGSQGTVTLDGADDLFDVGVAHDDVNAPEPVTWYAMYVRRLPQ